MRKTLTGPHYFTKRGPWANKTVLPQPHVESMCPYQAMLVRGHSYSFKVYRFCLCFSHFPIWVFKLFWWYGVFYL